MDWLDNFSTREKNLWSELLVDLVAGAYYYPKMIAMILGGADRLTGAAMASLVTGTVMVAIFAGIVVSVFLHTQKKPEIEDERDRLFRARGNTVGYAVLALCVVLIMGQVIIFEMMPNFARTEAPFDMSGLVIAHLLLVSLFLSSVSKSVVQLYYYRRGY